MKAMKFTCLLVCAVALTFAATGCKKKPTPITNIPGQPTGSLNDPNLAPGTEFKPEADSPFGVPLPPIDPTDPKWIHDRNALAVHTVHFDYDSAAIRNNERDNIQAVADYMKTAGGTALLIEGHCDERGTDEYNRALGERRALSVREAVIQAGADANRITTLSFGKDKKIALGNDEASHAKNRRGEFVVLTPR